MAGIYFHIPFCKQACSYCDFHFSTKLNKVDDVLKALEKELVDRSEEVRDEVSTIYFGGGSPSLLNKKQFERLFKIINDNYCLEKDVEITLEANPDDLTDKFLQDIRATGFNRLSIGVQSFYDEHLKFFNRVHNARQSEESIVKARKQGFNNINIDLIYGFQELTLEKWRANLEKVIDLDVNHLSAYWLTIEPGTLLDSNIRKGNYTYPKEQFGIKHFKWLLEWTKSQTWEQYEISNFCKEGNYSKHNTSYWFGKNYLGIGPSAHSFNGHKRRWNLANNPRYVKAIVEGQPYFEEEQLSEQDRYNEYIMTGLRTKWGVDDEHIERHFGKTFLTHFQQEARTMVEDELLIYSDHITTLTEKGKLVADKIASDLFVTN